MKFVCQRPSDTDLALEKEWSSQFELFRSSKYRTFMLQINWRIDSHRLWVHIHCICNQRRNETLQLGQNVNTLLFLPIDSRVSEMKPKGVNVERTTWD